jgi:hypothetical protein
LDVPKREQSDQSGIAPKLTALEEASLVHASETTAVVNSVLDPLRGPAPPQPVRRYELTSEGKKYLKSMPGALGQTDYFCYGQKAVDSLVKWTEPITSGTYSKSGVTNTYKIVSIAPWAEHPDVQRTFPDIKATLSGASRINQVAGLQLTTKGWEIPGS